LIGRLLKHPFLIWNILMWARYSSWNCCHISLSCLVCSRRSCVYNSVVRSMLRGKYFFGLSYNDLLLTTPWAAFDEIMRLKVACDFYKWHTYQQKNCHEADKHFVLYSPPWSTWRNKCPSRIGIGWTWGRLYNDLQHVGGSFEIWSIVTQYVRLLYSFFVTERLESRDNRFRGLVF
jgi:hypothetical protein